MEAEREQIQVIKKPISRYWHLLLRAYSKVDKISHHLLSISIKLLAGAFLLMCIVLLAFRFFVVPHVGDYKPEIEQILGEKLGRTVRISQVVGTWEGLRPHLEFQHVVLHDQEGHNALTLPQVHITLSWISLFVADVRLYKLEINQPELELKRNTDGKLYVAGWWMDPMNKGDVGALNWILAQRSIVINNGKVRWTDQLRNAPVLTLSNLNFVLRNQWRHHQFSLSAVPPTDLSGPIDIRADFRHHPFSENIADFLQWKGSLYAAFANADLNAWKRYVDYPVDVEQGDGAVRAWLTFDQAKVVDMTVELNLANVKARLEPEIKSLNIIGASGRFTNLTGSVNINKDGGSVQINSKDVALTISEPHSEQVLNADLISMNGNWMKQPENQILLNIENFQIAQQDMHARLYGEHLFSTTAKEKLNGVTNLTGTISHIDLAKVKNYLPASTDTDLRHWLSHGLLGGSLDDIHIRIKGDLAEFPFVKKGILDQNRFRITGKIIDAKVNYLPGDFSKDGTRPYWPVLNKINGQLTVDRQSIDIYAESGETEGIPVEKVHARIPDFLSKDFMLEIDGGTNSSAQAMLHYLTVSPILGWINNFTQDTTVSGTAQVKLKLAIPLARPNDTKVTGTVQFKDNNIALIKELPMLTQVKGGLEFNESGLTLKALKGNFLGGAVTVTGGTQKNGIIRMKADGQVSAEGIRKGYAQPELKNVLARIEGKTIYSAIIEVKNKQTEIWANSSLQGLALNLPAPLNKLAATSMPLNIDLLNVPAKKVSDVNAGTLEHDELKFSLGNIINAYYFRQRDLTNNAWKVLRGGVGLKAPTPTPKNGLAVHVNLASFNVDEFQELFPDKSTANVNAGHSPENVNLGQYLAPDALSIHADELVWLGKKLNKVVLNATRQSNVWQANIESQQVSGNVAWDIAEHGLGHITARLSTLTIPQTADNDVVDLLQNQRVHASIPGLDLTAESFELFGKKLGRLQLQARNVDMPNEAQKEIPRNVQATQWQIDSLRLTNPDSELTAQGKWINSETNSNTTKNQTELSYQLEMTNSGKLLDRLGYPNVISGGKGKLSGEVRWNGSPYSMDMPTLSGNVILDLHSGQFLKVDPGAAKLLGVLNLQSLPQRLALDFRDVFSEGFAFDVINGSADIEKGIAKTDNLKMHSSSATVVLSGTADITKETQNLHVVVIPEIDAAGASVVYGLAVNPLIGAGAFLAQLFLKKPLMKALTYEYEITGSWKEPHVVKSGEAKHHAQPAH